jgi:hypothetical protein
MLINNVYEMGSNSLRRALVGERAMFVSTFSNPKMVLASAESSGETSEFGNSLGGAIIKVSGFFDREIRFAIDAFERMLALARLPDPDRFSSRTEWGKIEERSDKQYYLISSLFLPSLSNSVPRDCAHRARARIAQTVFAIERFRLANAEKLPADAASLVPESLSEALMDPFDGQPLRFRLTPAGYVVYSIGSDGRDDGGAVSPKPNKGKDLAPADITFFVERQ